VTDGSAAPFVLTPGMLLYEQYLLVQQEEYMQWNQEHYEARWIAVDQKQQNAAVTICEVMYPLDSVHMPVFVRTATQKGLTWSAIPGMPPLLTVFMQHRRAFFVFARHSGISLQTRVQQQGTLSENEAFHCLQQITYLLRELGEQTPPIVHGWISPRQIISTRSGWQLRPFSILMTGGDTTFLQAPDLLQSAPYTFPEVALMSTDVASDLYSLLASLVYALTATTPLPADPAHTAPIIQSRNPSCSFPFAMMIAQGLHMRIQERYHHPSEVLNALSALAGPANLILSYQPERGLSQKTGQKAHTNPLTERLAISMTTRPSPSTPGIPVTVAFRPGDSARQTDQTSLLLNPDRLAPIPQCNDMLGAFLWSCLIIASTIIFLVIIQS
jgi:hypothetical protein